MMVTPPDNQFARLCSTRNCRPLGGEVDDHGAGFHVRTISAVMSTGAGLPGINAVVITASAAARGAGSILLRARNSSPTS